MKAKTILMTLLVALFITGLAVYFASADSKGFGNQSKGFVDANGDGINDNALDADGDGIPNGKDMDYVKPQDGSGKMSKNANRRFIDENGDGINDLALDSDGDGIPNCLDPDYVPTGQAKGKTRFHMGRSNKGRNAADANLAPIRDRLQDGSCGTCDGTGLKKTRRTGK